MSELATVAGGSSLVEADALERLREWSEDARGAAAPNTERALRADIAIFTGWCSAADVASLPASPFTVARFVDAMGALKAPATVRRYVSSISTFHRAAQLPNPAGAEKVKQALKRLHREKGRAQAQAAPLNRQLIDRMIGAAGDSLKGLRNRALLSLAYDTLCRRSEIAALMVDDMTIGADGAATVTIRRSKTDQEGAGMIRYVAADSVRHITAWLAAGDITNGALFRSVSKGGHHIGDELDAGEIGRLFKGMAIAAGVSAEDAARISGHSSRVGAAQDMVRLNVELPAVMQAGGWRTAEMVGRYTKQLDARRSGAAKLAVLQNRA